MRGRVPGLLAPLAVLLLTTCTGGARAQNQAPPQVSLAVARLVQLAYDARLSPRELLSLQKAMDEEWSQRPDSKADLSALAESVPRLAEDGRAESDDARAIIRHALEASGERDPGPLAAWVRAFRASLEPVDPSAGDPVTGRQVWDLLWAAVRLQAAGFGVPATVAERLPLGGIEEVAGRVSAPELLTHGTALAVAVAGQFDSPDGVASPAWASLARRVAGLPELELPSEVPVGSAHPTQSDGEWRAVRVPGTAVTLSIPPDWSEEPLRNERGQPREGYLLLCGPGGSGSEGPLRSAVRIFVGPASGLATSGPKGLEEESRGRVTEGGAEALFVVSGPYGGALSAAWGGDSLILYAAAVRGQTIVAGRGVWPLPEFQSDACYELFHRIWTSQRGPGLPAVEVNLETALAAVDSLPPISELRPLMMTERGEGWREVGPWPVTR